MEWPRDTLLADIAIGLLAGLVATKVYDVAQQALSWPIPKHIKEQEEQLRPEPTSRVAARKIGEGLGYQLDEEELKLATMGVHYGTGLVWGPVYTLLRRHGRMQPLGAGFVTGTAMSVIMDEVLVPVCGFCAPNQAFPLTTHVRGLLNHLVYGAAAALTAEALYQLTETTPGSRRVSSDSVRET